MTVSGFTEIRAGCSCSGPFSLGGSRTSAPARESNIMGKRSTAYDDDVEDSSQHRPSHSQVGPAHARAQSYTGFAQANSENQGPRVPGERCVPHGCRPVASPAVPSLTCCQAGNLMGQALGKNLKYPRVAQVRQSHQGVSWLPRQVSRHGARSGPCRRNWRRGNLSHRGPRTPRFARARPPCSRAVNRAGDRLPLPDSTAPPARNQPFTENDVHPATPCAYFPAPFLKDTALLT